MKIMLILSAVLLSLPVLSHASDETPHYAKLEIGMANLTTKLNDEYYRGGKPINRFAIGIGIGYALDNGFSVDYMIRSKESHINHECRIHEANQEQQQHVEQKIKSTSIMLGLNYNILNESWRNIIMPVIGVNVGVAQNTLSNFDEHDTHQNVLNVRSNGNNDAIKYNFAWSVSAGVNLELSKQFVIEILYKYSDHGYTRAQGVHTHGTILDNKTRETHDIIEDSVISPTRIKYHELSFGSKYIF